jgi:formylglycine-generating enzyme required for sulfatase activity
MKRFRLTTVFISLVVALTLISACGGNAEEEALATVVAETATVQAQAAATEQAGAAIAQAQATSTTQAVAATAQAQTAATTQAGTATAVAGAQATVLAQAVMATLTAEAQATPTPDTSVESIARSAFDAWAASNGEPYRDVQVLAEDNDGFFAHLRVLAWFRPDASQPWEERDAPLECRKVGESWQCDEWPEFRLTQGEAQRRADVTATAAAQATATAVAEATATAVAVHATATAIASLPFLERLALSTGIEFVFVPAGEFVMGSPNGEGNDKERPQHTVSLDSYWIGKTEVTNAQYARCVEAGGCPAPDNNVWNESSFAQHPVTDVSWEDAVVYAQWLTGQSGLTVRLPTEAEWEKAARGTDGRPYPWGNTDPSDRLLNYDRNVGSTTPVGIYPAGASPYGALDMAGNVWEWVADWYDSGYYKQSPARNPTGPESGNDRVLRGGSWFNNSTGVRAAFRNRLVPDFRHYDVGFRLVASGL